MKILVIIISFFFSVLFRLLIIKRSEIKNYFKNGIMNDSVFYFYLTIFFKSNKSGDYDKRSILSGGPVIWPSLFFNFINFCFTKSQLFKFSWLPNFIFYIILNLIISISFYFLDIDFFEIFLFYVFFLTSADNLLFDKSRIQYLSLQPRFLGVILNSLIIYFFIFFDLNVFVKTFIIILSFFGLNLSYFSRQTWFFVVFPYFLIINFKFALLVFFASLFFSFLIYPFEFYHSCNKQILFLYKYSKTYWRINMNGNSFKIFIKGLFARPLIESYPYISFFLLPFFFLQINNTNTSIYFDEIILKYNLLFLIIFILFVLTSLRKYAFIGECWRYISFTTYLILPIFYAISFKYFSLNTSLIVIFFNVFFFVLKKPLSYKNNNTELLNLLSIKPNYFDNANWYGIPFRSSTLPICMGFGLSSFEFTAGQDDLDINNKYFSSYPFLKWDLQLLKQNKITNIIVDKSYLAKAIEISNFSSSDLTLILESENYIIYETKR
jgi:hypothetical protein